MSDVGFNIQGGKVTKQAVHSLADGITVIFAAAYETHMDQETVRAALQILKDVGTVNHTNISHANLRMGG